MSNTRLLTVLLALTCICGAAAAQVAPAQPAPVQPVMPPVEPVLTHMPAGTMGFVVVNGIDDLFTKIETFYNEIGAPAGPMPPLQELMLSEFGSDFNPNGGFAAAMLDPSLFGVDLGELLSEGMGGGYDQEYVVTEDGEVVEVEVDDEGLEESPPIPYVLFVPGLDPANVLPPSQYEVSQEGDYTVLTNSWSEEKLYAVQAGGYVLVSPNPEALEMVRSADTFFADEVSAEEFLAISQADAAAYGNMQVSAPIISDLLENLTDMGGMMMMMPMADMESGLMSASLANVEEQLGQMASISVRYEFTDTGLKFAESVVFVEDSQIGQYYASQPPAGGSLVGMLPDLPYMVAFGARWEISEEMKAYSVETLSNMLNSPGLVDEFGQDVIDGMLSLAEEMYGNVSEMQFVVGGAPEGSGTIASAFVFGVEDAAGAMTGLPEDASLAETALNLLIATMGGEEGLTISVIQGAEMVAGVSVDHVVINHPEFDDADEDDLQQVEAVLGMREVKFMVASPDVNTLIVTFGGGSAMMAETIRTAQSGGTIGSAEGVAEVMAELPVDPYMVGLLSLGNIGKVGAATELAVSDDKGYLEWPLADMENTKPIAMAAAIDGATLHVVAFAPNDVIADTVSAVMAAQEASYQRMMEQMQNGRGAPPGWEEDTEPVEGEDEGF